MRTWTRLIPAVVLILAFTPMTLRAADPDLTSLNERLNQLSRKVETLQSDATANSLRGSRVEEELRAVREELRLIREILERMAARQQDAIRIQPGYNPESVRPGAPPIGVPATATITLRNVYSAPATVRINDQSYFVGPNATRTVPLPVGPFQYSVDVEGYGMVLPPRTEVLRAPGYLIRVYPQP